MLFDPTAIERLSQLVDNMIEKQHNLQLQLESNEGEKSSFAHAIEEKDSYITALHSEIESKDNQINSLKEELHQKDSEIEAIVSKIESMLG